jgi:hypothetical protein
MTLSIAWIRKIKDCEELIVASDSRLSGARDINCCQKILPLPRSDSFVCFAGESHFAYPLVQQMFSAINVYERGRDRSLDICDLRGHVLKVFNKLLEAVDSSFQDMKTPDKDTEFLFGGYSWINKTFEIWKLHYDAGIKSFTFHPAHHWANKEARVMFAGDMAPEANKRLINLIRERYGVTPQGSERFSFNWEPFEVLRDLLREGPTTEATSGKKLSVGGPPQVLKVYQHMNCKMIGVYWPKRSGGNITIGGRSLLDYEKPDCWILDPDSLSTSHLYYSNYEKKDEATR